MGDPEDFGDEAELEALEMRVADLETAQDNGSSAGSGCGAVAYSLGATLAVVISWDENHAVLWAVLHGVFSWFYVIYAVLAHSERVKLL